MLIRIDVIYTLRWFRIYEQQKYLVYLLIRVNGCP